MAPATIGAFSNLYLGCNICKFLPSGAYTSSFSLTFFVVFMSSGQVNSTIVQTFVS